MLGMYGKDWTAYSIPESCVCCGRTPPTTMIVERSPEPQRPEMLCDACAHQEHNVIVIAPTEAGRERASRILHRI